MEGIWFPVFWSFSGVVLPSHHPMYENLGDQQAEDARTNQLNGKHWLQA